VLELISDSTVVFFASVVGLILGLQVVINIVTVSSLRGMIKEREVLHREIFGLVKKIEGLTSSKREVMLKHYDGLLEVLSTRLPTAVANQSSQLIFETESKILARLAELEPNLQSDEQSKAKLDDLIKSMENLEKTLVNLTSDAVKSVMVEGRRSLFEADSSFDTKLAA
jgi:arginyl-tRNA synthetase